MVTSTHDCLTHRPETVVTFIRKLIAEQCEHSGPERRIESRNPVTIPVTIQCLDGYYRPTGSSITAVTNNLSGGGIGLVSPRPIDCKSILVLLKSQSGESLNLIGTVRHCTAVGDQYHVGASFVVQWDATARRHREGEA
jgi:hypothetical protein